MTDRLLLVAGPSRGAVVPLEGEEVFVGRDASCAVCLPDATLSRRHAILERSSSGWTLRDLGSMNGVRVNGVPVSEHPLADGDRIELGSSVAAFRVGGADPPRDHGLAATAWDADSTIRLPASRATFLAETPGPTSSRAERDLPALLAAGRRFAHERSEAGLADALLDSALPAVRASSGAVFLAGEGNGLHEAARRSGPPPCGEPALLLASAAETLARREAVVFLVDAASPGAPTAATVPLLAGDEPVGVLGLLARPGCTFDEDDLQLLFGLAGSAATAMAVVRHIAWLEGERRRLEAPAGDDELRGDSRPIAAVRALLARAAAAETTILLTGESGTGKELAARAIHARSARREGPFVAVNAAALVETLVESELFGHEKGAFTGAVARRKGRLEAAHGGTLFLDEVGEMSPAAQAKLLRVLETREFERVGGQAPVKVDVRVVCATNRDLAAEARAGRFREDLYFRLAVLTIDLPPLRARREDVPALASLFLARHAARLGKKFDGFSPAALARLVAYDWPGNVRELGNAVERAAVLSDGGLVRPEDLPEALLESEPAAGASPGLGPYHDAVNRAKREAVEAALARSGGVVTEAARLLGLHPNYLHRLLNQLGLRPAGRNGA